MDLIAYYKCKYNVVVICQSKSIDDEFEALSLQEGIDVIPIRDNSILSSYPIILARAISLYKPQLIITSVGTPGLYAMNLLCRIPSLYFCHTYPHSNSRFDLFPILLKICLGDKNLLLTVSNFAESRIIKQWGLETKNKFIKVMYPANKYSGVQFDVVPRTMTVITAGHLEEYKNPLLWIDIAKEVLKVMPEVKFIWAGDGSLKFECMRVAKNSSNISFIGNIDDLNSLYASSMIYLQPSRIESFGMAVLESMYFGLVPIVANTGGLPEVVGKCGYVIQKEDEKEYSKIIIDLLENSEKRNEMAVEAKKRSNKFFNKKQWLNAMDELHDEVLNKNE